VSELGVGELGVRKWGGVGGVLLRLWSLRLGGRGGGCHPEGERAEKSKALLHDVALLGCKFA